MQAIDYEQHCTGRCISRIDKELHGLFTDNLEAIEREFIGSPYPEHEWGMGWYTLDHTAYSRDGLVKIILDMYTKPSTIGLR